MMCWRTFCGVVAICFTFAVSAALAQQQEKTKPRARDLGVPFDGTPGPLNAITDVAGVSVGHTTLISGEGKLQIGKGPVRTGVTAVMPRGKDSMNNPVFAGWWSLNGNGEMAGDDHEYAQRRRGARCGDSMARAARATGCDWILVVAAGGGGDVGRLAERHQRLPREAGARLARD